MTHPETFRAKSSYVYAAGAWLLLLGLGWAESVGRPASGVVGVVLVAGAVGYGAYLLFVHPRVTVFDEGIEIHNPMSDHRIGWQDVLALDTKYTLSVQTADAIVHAWAAPAQGRYHARTIHPEDMRHMRDARDGRTLPAGHSPRAHSGVAYHLASVRWDRFAGPGSVATVQQRHTVRLVGIGVAVLAGLVLMR